VPDAKASARDGGAAPDPARETASNLATALRSGRYSARDVVEAHLDRIAGLNPGLAAFITVDESGARAQADRLDKLPPAQRGALHGLPVAVKDLTDTAGLRTTYGSAHFADHVPATDDHLVARLRSAGAVILGKTNTPEFGFGAICHNPLCGPTRNPFDRALTSGGSSGGSAVAVAMGMAALAHGTDFGGSVRTPASFCGVTSIRPTPGTISSPSRGLGWDTLSTHGVIARNVADCALMLDAIAGADPRDPTSRLAGAPSQVDRPRLATSVDLGGVAPMSAACRARFAEVVAHLADNFGPIASAAPECRGAPAAFKTLRAALIRHSYGHLADRFEGSLTPTVAWNIAQGENISAGEYLAAETDRTSLYRRFIKFFADTDLLITPAASVLPWPNEIPEVTAIDGHALPDILDYLTITSVVSLAGFPVLTLPSPQRSHALPFGVQVIARPGEEALLITFGLLMQAAGFTHHFAP
jgi:amidase